MAWIIKQISIQNSPNYAKLNKLGWIGEQVTLELITEIMSKWEELNIYLPPTTDPIETQKRVEQDLIFTYLGALDPSYDAIRSQS